MSTKNSLTLKSESSTGASASWFIVQFRCQKIIHSLENLDHQCQPQLCDWQYDLDVKKGFTHTELWIIDVSLSFVIDSMIWMSKKDSLTLKSGSSMSASASWIDVSLSFVIDSMIWMSKKDSLTLKSDHRSASASWLGPACEYPACSSPPSSCWLPEEPAHASQSSADTKWGGQQVREFNHQKQSHEISQWYLGQRVCMVGTNTI